jgi:hypothetical protein
VVTLILRHASLARRFHGNLQLSGSGELGDRLADIVLKNLKPNTAPSLAPKARWRAPARIWTLVTWSLDRVCFLYLAH